MNVLFVDTETTGLMDFSSAPDAPFQPRMIQLGAILADEVGKVLGQVNLIVKPDGWVVSEGAQAIHGISTNLCAAAGVACKTVLALLDELGDRAGVVVAHNAQFDHSMISLERHRARQLIPHWPAWFMRSWHCTMKEMTPICRLPGRRGFKWPTLREAHLHLFNEGFDQAHNALADVQACARIYFEVRRRIASGEAL